MKNNEIHLFCILQTQAWNLDVPSLFSMQNRLKQFKIALNLLLI